MVLRLAKLYTHDFHVEVDWTLDGFIEGDGAVEFVSRSDFVGLVVVADAATFTCLRSADLDCGHSEVEFDETLFSTRQLFSQEHGVAFSVLQPDANSALASVVVGLRQIDVSQASERCSYLFLKGVPCVPLAAGS